MIYRFFLICDLNNGFLIVLKLFKKSASEGKLFFFFFKKKIETLSLSDL